MKNKFIIFFLLLSVSVCAQAQLDTLQLKNHKKVAGYIFKMDDGKISIASGKDTAVYTADEVQGIMFCHAVRGSGSSYSSGKTSSSSSSSYSGNPCDENAAEKGTVLFRCNRCGGSGSLSIKGKNDDSKTSALCAFTLDEGESFFEHAEKLWPGNYTWSYSDDHNNATSGKLTIKKGEEKKIILFEKE